MNWERVPIIFVALAIWRGIRTGIHSAFVRFPMYMVGYRWCDWCKRAVSPREGYYEIIYAAQGHGYEEHLCGQCDAKRVSV